MSVFTGPVQIGRALVFRYLVAVLAGLGLVLIALGVLGVGIGVVGIVGIVGIGVLVVHDWHLLFVVQG